MESGLEELERLNEPRELFEEVKEYFVGNLDGSFHWHSWGDEAVNRVDSSFVIWIHSNGIVTVKDIVHNG